MVVVDEVKGDNDWERKRASEQEIAWRRGLAEGKGRKRKGEKERRLWVR